MLQPSSLAGHMITASDIPDNTLPKFPVVIPSLSSGMCGLFITTESCGWDCAPISRCYRVSTTIKGVCASLKQSAPSGCELPIQWCVYFAGHPHRGAYSCRSAAVGCSKSSSKQAACGAAISKAARQCHRDSYPHDTPRPVYTQYPLRANCLPSHA